MEITEYLLLSLVLPIHARSISLLAQGRSSVIGKATSNDPYNWRRRLHRQCYR